MLEIGFTLKIIAEVFGQLMNLVLQVKFIILEVSLR